MKYVYVLTSTPKDLYYEQALMSVWSLRYRMPDADIIVLVDDKTFKSFEDEKRSELKKIAEVKSIEFDDKVTNVERSRLIKTAIPDYVSGDFLYIDCDTIIADDLSDIEKASCETLTSTSIKTIFLQEIKNSGSMEPRQKALILTAALYSAVTQKPDTPFLKCGMKYGNIPLTQSMIFMTRAPLTKQTTVQALKCSSCRANGIASQVTADLHS